MSSTYTHVMRTCGISAGITAGSYGVASVMAISDGHEIGIEIPRPVSALAIVLIVCCTILGGGAWIVRRAHRIAAEEYTRPIVREELDKALADAMPLLIASLTASLDRVLEPKMQDIAARTGNRTIAGVRAAVTQDLTDIAQGLYRRGQIVGAIGQANSTGRGVVKPIRSVYAMTPGDGD